MSARGGAAKHGQLHHVYTTEATQPPATGLKGTDPRLCTSTKLNAAHIKHVTEHVRGVSCHFHLQ